MTYRLYIAEEYIFPGHVFTLNPLSGNLIKLPKNDHTLINLKLEKYNENIKFLNEASAFKKPYYPKKHSLILSKVLLFGFNLWLHKLFGYMHNIARPKIIPFSGQIKNLASNYGNVSTDGYCLNRSLSLFSKLKGFGHKAKICIGLFTPTNQMHAWVMIENLVILENEDYINHFQIIYIYS